MNRIIISMISLSFISSIQSFYHQQVISSQDISMKKKPSQLQPQQSFSKERRTQTNLNNSKANQRKKPIPQIYSCNRIPSSYHVHNNVKSYRHPGLITEIHNVESLHSNSHHYHSRVKHGQYITQESLPLLQERLRSIRQSYESLIAEQKNKNNDRAEVIISLIEEIQSIHSEKVNEIKRLIGESEDQKRDVGFVDNKMNEIKGNIEDLIEQSNTLKVKNGELEKKIQRKRKENKEKQSQLQEINKQLLEVRGQLQSFQLNNLKNNKLNRQILEIFNSAPKLSDSN